MLLESLDQDENEVFLFGKQLMSGFFFLSVKGNMLIEKEQIGSQRVH